MKHKECIACSLASAGRKQVVVGEANPNAKIGLIGEAPGEVEDREGLPLIGPSGQFLRQECMKEAGLREEDCFFSNICSCRPRNNDLRPHADALLICPKLWLEDEIKGIPIVVALGGTSGSYWMPGKRVSELEQLSRVLPNGQIIVGSRHPAARGDKDEKRRSIVRSLRRAKRYAE